MSSGQRARTLANFPAMKQRGGRRRHYQRATQTRPDPWQIVTAQLRAVARALEAASGLAMHRFFAALGGGDDQ